MTATRTRAEMERRARELAGLEDSDFISPQESADTINEHCQELFDRIVRARGHEFFAREHVYPNVAAGTRDLALPPDFYQALAYEIVKGSDSFQGDTWRHQDLARLRYMESQGGQNLVSVRFRCVQQKLVMWPSPGVECDVHLHYIPTMPRLMSPGATYDGINGWELYAELGAAAEWLDKMESFEQANLLKGRKDAIGARIDQMAGARDAGMPDKIVDTRKDWWGGNWPHGWDG